MTYRVDEGRPRTPLSGGGDLQFRTNLPQAGHLLYTPYMSDVYAPISGADAARLAWLLTREELDNVIPPRAPESAIEEVKIAFAAWCSARPKSLFADLAAAWNVFIEPRYGLAGTAVLLPGTPCPMCAARRYWHDEMNRVSYPDCSYCSGKGHLPPRAIPARPAPAGLFQRAADKVEEEPAPRAS